MFKKLSTRLALVSTGVLASAGAFAAGEGTGSGLEAAISSAKDSGISAVTLAVGAVIAVAAVAMGFSIIRGIMSR